MPISTCRLSTGSTTRRWRSSACSPRNSRPGAWTTRSFRWGTRRSAAPDSCGRAYRPCAAPFSCGRCSWESTGDRPGGHALRPGRHPRGRRDALWRHGPHLGRRASRQSALLDLGRTVHRFPLFREDSRVVHFPGGYPSMPSHRLVAILVLVLAAAAPACNDSQAEHYQAVARARTWSPSGEETFRMVLEAPGLSIRGGGLGYDALPSVSSSTASSRWTRGSTSSPPGRPTWTISRDGRFVHLSSAQQRALSRRCAAESDDVVYSIRRLMDPARDKKSIAVSYCR
jgi:hypothetical protein